MKDQKKVLFNALNNDIPAFVIVGTDKLALEVIKFYSFAARKEKCSKEFIDDMEEVIKDFAAFQAQEKEKVKLPD